MSDTLEIFGTEYTGVAGVKATDSNSGTKTYIRPQGAKSITANGTGIDVAEYATVNVNVSGGGGGNLQEKTNIDPTTSSQTIYPDTGYDGLSSVQINAMPSGTAGTPTATKGTVSNHSIAVTPSVTNTTGYITGGTKTGTAVTVSASELVSGTRYTDSNGTKDITEYKYVTVAVPTGEDGNNMEYGFTDGTMPLVGVAQVGYAEVGDGALAYIGMAVVGYAELEEEE